VNISYLYDFVIKSYKQLKFYISYFTQEDFSHIVLNN